MGINLTEVRPTEYATVENIFPDSKELGTTRDVNFIIETTPLTKDNTLLNINLKADMGKIDVIFTQLKFATSSIGTTALLDFINTTKLNEKLDLSDFEYQDLVGHVITLKLKIVKNKFYDANKKNSKQSMIEIVLVKPYTTEIPPTA